MKLVALTSMIFLIAFTVKKKDSYNNTAEPLALVKYKDIIYQCQGIIRTNCGHTIHCGKMSVHCVTDIEVEYLN